MSNGDDSKKKAKLSSASPEEKHAACVALEALLPRRSEEWKEKMAEVTNRLEAKEKTVLGWITKYKANKQVTFNSSGRARKRPLAQELVDEIDARTTNQRALRSNNLPEVLTAMLKKKARKEKITVMG